MKRNIKTKYKLTAYTDWPLKSWKQVEESDLLDGWMKGEKIDKYSIFGIDEKAAVQDWVEKRGKDRPAEIKKVIQVGKYKIILFSYYRYSRGRAWWSSGGYIKQKMALIELKK